MIWFILEILILVILAVILGLFKNYYLITAFIIGVILFVILKKLKYKYILIAIFGSSLLLSIFVAEITKIQLVPFPQLEIKGKIYPIYQDNPDGEYYRFNSNNPNDLKQTDELKNKEIFSEKNQDGSWKIEKGTTRIDLFTHEAGVLNQDDMMEKIETWDFNELAKIGYWLYPSDFKNIEFTMIFKMKEAEKSDQSVSIVSRSIIHDSKGEEEIKDYPNAYCGGSSYHNNIALDGKLQMKKEQYHADYIIDKPNEEVDLGNLYNKKIGFKSIVYNFDDDSKVKLESYVDVENEGRGPYHKVHEKIDDGKWAINSGEAKMDECGALTEGAIITWGSPKVILKTNNLDFDLYDIEIREIVPP